MDALYEINASPQHGREPFLKMIAALNDVKRPENHIRIKFTGVFCPSRLSSVESAYWPVPPNDPDYRRPAFLEEEWLSILDDITWYGSIFIRSLKMNSVMAAVKDIIFSTGIIDASLNRVTLVLDHDQVSLPLLDKLAELGFNVVYTSYEDIPDGMPLEVPTELFTFAKTWNNPYACSMPNNIVDLTKNPVCYQGDVPNGILGSKILIARAGVSKAFSVFRSSAKEIYFGTDRVSSYLFTNLIDAFSLGHEKAGILSAHENSLLNTHDASVIVDAMDLSCFADSCEEIGYAIDLAAQMSKINNIWVHTLAEYGLQPGFSFNIRTRLGDSNHLFEVLSKTASVLGIDSAINAFYDGVPLGDICV